MGFTIYGGRTINGLMVDDMVANWDDIVYRPEALGISGAEKFFARVCHVRNKREKYVPAVAVFHEEYPFIPLYAVEINKRWEDYSETASVPQLKGALRHTSKHRKDIETYLEVLLRPEKEYYRTSLQYIK